MAQVFIRITENNSRSLIMSNTNISIDIDENKYITIGDINTNTIENTPDENKYTLYLSIEKIHLLLLDKQFYNLQNNLFYY